MPYAVMNIWKAFRIRRSYGIHPYHLRKEFDCNFFSLRHPLYTHLGGIAGKIYILWTQIGWPQQLCWCSTMLNPIYPLLAVYQTTMEMILSYRISNKSLAHLEPCKTQSRSNWRKRSIINWLHSISRGKSKKPIPSLVSTLLSRCMSILLCISVEDRSKLRVFLIFCILIIAHS